MYLYTVNYMTFPQKIVGTLNPTTVKKGDKKIYLNLNE
jgi:hypothetical protein